MGKILQEVNHCLCKQDKFKKNGWSIQEITLALQSNSVHMRFKSVPFD